MMRSLVSENSRISFEGKLKNAGLSEIDGASSNESTILKRATTWPTQDYIALPLTDETVPLIHRAVDSRVAFGPNGILHVQIEKDNKLAFAAFDGFHEEATVVFFGVSADALAELVAKGVLQSFTRGSVDESMA